MKTKLIAIAVVALLAVVGYLAIDRDEKDNQAQKSEAFKRSLISK